MVSAYDLLHGTQQSSHLSHYGTKGMRWGVRKAQARAKKLDKKVAKLKKEQKSNEAEFNRAAKANEVPNKHVRDTSAKTLNDLIKTERQAKKQRAIADSLEAKSNKQGKAGSFAKSVKEQHAKEVAFGRDRDVTILKTLGMNKAADAVAANKSAGHALGKKVKSVITSSNGKKTMQIGAVVVASTIAMHSITGKGPIGTIIDVATGTR